ncbi:MAG: hypothetical protein GQ574_01600 [Crocinitomix sp.]|nr:hypothetical protein [Crocinitomix sp.]
MINNEIQEKEAELIELTAVFCAEKLDDDYAQLCGKLIQKMSAEEIVPFKRGKIEIWAAAVIHALGSKNFLFDKSFEPYINAQDISDHFGAKKATISNKARQIKDLYDMVMYDDEFATQKLKENNPFDNMVMVDGFIVKVSNLPVDIQELIKQERAAGRDISFTTGGEE